MRIFFVLLWTLNLYAFDYFDLIENRGSYQEGEIEIVIDPIKIQEIEALQKSRLLKKGYDLKQAVFFSRTGIIAEDSYILWIRDAVIFPQGFYGTYDRIAWRSSLDGKVGMAVLPILDDQRLLLILTYRHATRSWELEIPRGKREPAEEVIETVRRELKEETGVHASEIGYLGATAPDSGILTSIVPIFWAKIKHFGISDIEKTEAIESNIILTVEELEKAYLQGFLKIGQKKAYARDPFLAYALLQARLRKIIP